MQKQNIFQPLVSCAIPSVNLNRRLDFGRTIKRIFKVKFAYKRISALRQVCYSVSHRLHHMFE